MNGQEMKPCPPLQPLRDTSFRSERGGPTVLSGPLPSYFSPQPDPAYILGEGVICLWGVIFPAGSPTLKNLIPEGHFNSRGRRVHLLLNARLASRSPDGCGAHRQLPLRAEPPPQPRGPQESPPLLARLPAELSDPQLAPFPSGGMRRGWRYLRSHSCGRAGNCC